MIIYVKLGSISGCKPSLLSWVKATDIHSIWGWPLSVLIPVAMQYLIGGLSWGHKEFAKLRALRAFVPSHIRVLRAFVPSCLKWLCPLRAFAPYVPWFLRALIMRLNYATCAPYLLFVPLTHSQYKISYKRQF